MRLAVSAWRPGYAHGLRMAEAARGAMRLAYAHSVGGRPIYAHGRGVAGVAPEGAGPRRFWLPTFEAYAMFALLGRCPTPGLGRSAALGRSLFREGMRRQTQRTWPRNIPGEISSLQAAGFLSEESSARERRYHQHHQQKRTCLSERRSVVFE